MLRNNYVESPKNTAPLIVAGQILAAFVLGLGLFLAVLTLAPFAYALAYEDVVFPGVSVYGVDLSEMSVSDASAHLAANIHYPDQGRIAIQEGAQAWIVRPRELGFYVNVQASAQAAYAIGRSGDIFHRFEDMFQAWSQGIDLPVAAVYDERVAQQYLKAVADQVDRPIIEATLGVSGVEVVVNPGQVGRKADVPSALAALRQPLQSMQDAIILLAVSETAPVILDASEQAEVARKILSAPLVVDVPDRAEGSPGPWTFEPAALAQMLSIERAQSEQGEHYQVGLNSQILRSFLETIAPSFARTPQNARFMFNDESRQLEVIQNAVIGRSLNIEASLNLINDRLFAGEHQVTLVIDSIDPQVPDSVKAQDLGITEQIIAHSSYFFGSSASRLQNIQLAAARFHGVLVPPGATFSMGDTLGDVSLDEGYAEALIIYGDRTIQGVGGGVCQVSTTLFRTVFFAGYPINERSPHAYRVGYYEQTSNGGYDTDLAGLDATVFTPVVDFKFTNNTPYWLLMETYFSEKARRLTWKIYSTSDGRSVEWKTSGLKNITEPPEPRYEENPDLGNGVIKQVDWATKGADVTVTRTVRRGDSILFEDVYATHYQPWPAMYQYGPGTEIPTPEASPGE